MATKYKTAEFNNRKLLALRPQAVQIIEMAV